MNKHFPILYTFRRCPYAMRARLALVSSGQNFEIREVVLRNKPQEMLEASPKGTVPVLVLPDGTVIEESLEIMHWALNQNDPEQLLDLTPDQKALSDDLIAENDGPFKKALDRYKYATRFPEEQDKDWRAEGEKFLQKLDGLLDGSPWLFGEKPKLADFSILPFIRQFRIADETWFDEEAPYPHLKKWLAAFLESDRLQKIMYKYDPWQPGQKPVMFEGVKK